jgi:hypothetical protein
MLELSLCACAEVASSASTSKAAAAVAKVATPAVNQERCFSAIFLYVLDTVRSFFKVRRCRGHKTNREKLMISWKI